MSVIEQSEITKLAGRFINNTNQSIFLTGKAGTGKTTFLRNIKEYTHKNVIVAAPTGIAAINAGGVTLHSLFQLPFGSIIPENISFDENINIQLNTPQSLLRSFQMNKTKRNMLRELELLIIDEVSMLRADLLDGIDAILKHVRRRRDVPFGGVQVLFIGDLLQLPPVVKDEEWHILSRYYKGMYFFHARVLQQNIPLYLELDKIYRQADPVFVNLLNNLRDNKTTEKDIQLLNKHYNPDFEQKNKDGFILLTTHNRIADEKNQKALKNLDQPSYYYKASIEGDFTEYMFPIEEKFELKEGAQVMFIKNDYSGEQRYFNGKIGFVSSLSDEEVTVSFNDGTQPAQVEPYTWENKKYSLNSETNEIEEKVVGTFKHLPLKLAWAITVHKSQGLTFDKAIIDVGRAFAPGQIYVALSRLTSLDGLILTSEVPTKNLSPDSSLKDFTDTRNDPKQLEEKLELESKRYFAEFIVQAFDFTSLIKELGYHVSSYTKDEKRSVKQQHKSWAANLLEKTNPLKKTADSFQVQVRNIVLQKEDDFLQKLNERLRAAIGYFEPLLQELSDIVFDKINDLGKQKGVKKYVNELRDIDGLYARQIQIMYKANALTESAINNTEFSKEEIKEPELVTRRKKTAPKKSEKTKKATKKKTSKPDTKVLSFELFKAGKTVKQIALERTLVPGTIEGHLSYYVRTGEIAITELIDEEKYKKVVDLVEELETTNMGPIKANAGDSLTFGEIRLAISGILAAKNNA